MEAVVFNMVLYSLLGDGVIAIAGPRVVHTRFGKSLVTDLQLYLGFLRSILYIYSVDISANPHLRGGGRASTTFGCGLGTEPCIEMTEFYHTISEMD